MSSALLPATHDIAQTVKSETASIGGTIQDCLDDGSRLFLRALLPMVRTARPGDRIQGGVAVMTAEQEICVHPYTFREVCRNGAIRAEATQTRAVRRVHFSAPAPAVTEAMDALRAAFQACSAPEAFAAGVAQMRSATEKRAGSIIDLVRWVRRRLPADCADSLIAELLDGFQQQPDRSLFGLMNAVTSVARDQREPHIRWHLEALGGAVPALASPVRKRPPARQALPRPRQTGEQISFVCAGR